jgi:hypothetical protein
MLCKPALHPRNILPCTSCQCGCLAQSACPSHHLALGAQTHQLLLLLLCLVWQGMVLPRQPLGDAIGLTNGSGRYCTPFCCCRSCNPSTCEQQTKELRESCAVTDQIKATKQQRGLIKTVRARGSGYGSMNITVVQADAPLSFANCQ